MNRKYIFDIALIVLTIIAGAGTITWIGLKILSFFVPVYTWNW